jgi:dihydrofolate synthase/folylpolyglutamate synthase
LRVVAETDREVAMCRALPLPLAGEFQVINAALATATVSALHQLIPVPEEVLRTGLRQTQWPGRFDVRRRGRQTLILDGAHNRSAFQALAGAVTQRFPGCRYGLVLGMLADKDAVSAAEYLLPGAGRAVIVPVHTSRGADPAVLAEAFSAVGTQRPVSMADNLSEAIDQLAGEDPIVITGSLYLIGEMLEQLSASTISERQLNDWSRRP